MSGRSVLDEAIAGSGRVGDLHHELEALQHAMGDPDRADEMDTILERFGEVQEEYEHLGGYALESQAREVLHGLGFDDDRIDGDVGALSGGWKMRVAMARVLLGRPDVLLMDEPTNHLDIESIVWLEAFLKRYPGALLMTSHDRDFMNRIVTRIAEIDGGEITAYSGNYDFYERERALARGQSRGRVRAPAGDAGEGAALHRALRRARRQGGAGAEPGQGAREDREDRAAEEARGREVRLPAAAAIGRRGRGARGRAQGLRRARRLRRADLTIRRGERWCVMGRNGAGKTTLLKMIAGALAPDGGDVTLGASLKMGYFAQQALDLLDPALTVWEQIAAGLPAREHRRAAQPARRLPVLGRRRRQADPRAVGRREDAPRRWRGCCSIRRTSSCSTSRPTTSIWRPRRCWSRRSRDFDGTMLFVSHDRTFLRGLSNRVLELGGESGTDAEPHAYPGLVRRVRAAHRPRGAGRARLARPATPELNVDSGVVFRRYFFGYCASALISRICRMCRCEWVEMIRNHWYIS